MELLLAMNLRRSLGLGSLLVLLPLSFLFAPLSGAASIDFDLATGSEEAAQGDILETQCANLGEDLGGALGCDTDDKVIDFTKYSGDFEGPDPSGYNEALTQSDNAREFIQRILNFALGFLGLAAVLMMIYGGARYVLSAGDDEGPKKAKKTITYAATGIIIILGSFAFVNTLIGAGGGTDQASNVGGGDGATTITEAGASFDVDSVLFELERITANYLISYQTYLTVSQEVAYMSSVEMPAIVDITETDATLGGFIEFGIEYITGQDDSISDQYQLIDERQVEDYLEKLRESVSDIQGQTDSLSDTFEASQELYNYLRSGTRLQTFVPSWISWLLPAAQAKDLQAMDQLDDSDFKQDIGDPFEVYVPGCESRSANDVFDYGLGVSVYETVVTNIDDNICGYFLPRIQAAADTDYAESVDALLEDLGDLRDLFDTEGVGGSGLEDIVTAFADAEERLTLARESINNATVRDIVSSFDALYTYVKNIDFVQVRLTASTVRGNAPLLVRFDALGTEDPSGFTVADDQIEWDLDGDGEFDESLGEDGAPVGAATSMIYTEPGTYRARVRVKSQDANIAAGVATVSIVVEAPRSIIVLEAEVSGERTVLADYRNFPHINQDKYKVTESEGKAGITLDASQSTDGDGNSSGLVFAEWDFGDNDKVSGDWNNYKTVNHAYGEPGRYDVSLVLTDKNGVQDRKYFTLYVASPAARLRNFPNAGPFGTAFTFDASASSTEIGTIVNYQWAATLNGQPYALEGASGERITQTFEQPGVYTITLVVTDSSKKTDTTSVSVLVESREPVPSFNFEVPQSNKPAQFILDASESYDPDEGDTLTYDWEFDGVADKDYRILENKGAGEELLVEFLRTGDMDVTLTVKDQHEGELQKTASLKKTVPVNSLLDLELTVQGDFTRYLDDEGEAEIEFVATNKSGAATGFEIDYGDGENEFGEGIARGQLIFTHVYDTAGVFYVTLTAFDDENNANTVTKRVYIGAGDAPIAVLDVVGEGKDIGSGPTYIGNTKTTFTFDATDSLNVDGSKNNLEYSWNFGDGTTSKQSRATHIYEEQATYTVVLTVRDREDSELEDQEVIEIEIQGIKPEIRSVSITPQGSSLETPVKLNVSVDAKDEDGRITFVKGWYVDPKNSSEELGTVVSQSPNFTLTLNTQGESGELHDYVVYVEVTDNDNQTVSSLDELGADRAPKIQVVNGPNEAPVAVFTVDRTSVFLGESITLSSTSTDKDGRIVKYWWDLEGDGFYNNEAQTSSSYEWTPTVTYPDGVEVQLKVEDDTGADDISEPVRLYVDTLADAPEAAFRSRSEGLMVLFENASTFDEENGSSLQGVQWDFDLDTDSDRNGFPDDDVDSEEIDPQYKYRDFGTYNVGFRVTDTTGQTTELEKEVRVVDAEDPYADFTFEQRGTSINFDNKSTTDEEAGIYVESYAWDFNLAEDSDGDKDPTNDVDSTSASPSYDYDEYGSYEVMLTITDDLGRVDRVTVPVTVGDPVSDVEAVLSSLPTTNEHGQIILTTNAADITFFYGATGGSEHYHYEIDKNIFFDTGGDGVRDNDVDFESDDSGEWVTHFDKAYGQIVTKLTVTDEENGEKGVATIQVVFQGFLGSANLLSVTPNQMLFLLIGAALVVTLAVFALVASKK